MASTDKLHIGLERAAELADASLKETVKYRDEVLHVFNAYSCDLKGIKILLPKTSSDHVKTTLASFSQLLDDLKNKLNDLATKADEDLFEAYADLETNSRFVTIMLFGRTRTGKSTTMEAMTGGDGKTIGIGKQNTTTEIKEYYLPLPFNDGVPEGPALRIIDTPGIEGLEGEALAKMAERFVERSDHIFFLLTDDKASSSELDRFGLIQTQGKGVTVLLNVKSKDEDLDLLHNEPELIFRDNELDGHRRRISGYLAQHFEMSLPPVIPYHARAAWLGRRPENLLEEGLQPDILVRHSGIHEIERRISLFIEEESCPTRIRAPRDLLNSYIISVKNELRPFAGQFRELIGKYRSLRQGIEKGVEKARQRANRSISEIQDCYQKADDQIPGMVDELINAGKGGKALSNRWKLLLANSGIPTITSTFADTAKNYFYKETQEKWEIADFDAKFGSTDSIGKQFDEYEETKESMSSHKYARAGLRAGIGTAASVAAGVAITNFWNPVGWVAAAVAAVTAVGSIAAGLGAEHLAKKATDRWEKSDKQKLYKRRSEIICNLNKLLWDDHKAICSLCNDWLDKLVAAYNNELDKTFLPAGRESEKLWQVTVGVLDQLDNVATRLNFILVHQLFNYVVPEAHKGSINVIGVAREPGYATKLLVQGDNTLESSVIGFCVGRSGSRVRQLSLHLGGEQISFVDAKAALPTQILQALSPAKLNVEEIRVKSDDNGVEHAHIIGGGGQISRVLGRHGINIRLASELLNMRIYCDMKEARK